MWLQEYFHPAVENIRLNNGDNAVSEEHMQTVCRQILEEVIITWLWLTCSFLLMQFIVANMIQILKFLNTLVSLFMYINSLWKVHKKYWI